MSNPISKEKILKLNAEKASFHLVDVRTAEEYASEHVPGAVNIPSEKIEELPFDKDEMIVCICNHGNKRCQGAAEQANNMGFTNVYYLEGGTAGWFGHE